MQCLNAMLKCFCDRGRCLWFEGADRNSDDSSLVLAAVSAGRQIRWLTCT